VGTDRNHDSLLPYLRDERELLDQAILEFQVVTKALYKDKIRWNRQNAELEKALAIMHTEAREKKRKHAAQKLRSVEQRLQVHETFIGELAAKTRGCAAVRIQRLLRGVRGRQRAGGGWKRKSSGMGGSA